MVVGVCRLFSALGMSQLETVNISECFYVFKFDDISDLRYSMHRRLFGRKQWTWFSAFLTFEICFVRQQFSQREDEVSNMTTLTILKT